MILQRSGSLGLELVRFIVSSSRDSFTLICSFLAQPAGELGRLLVTILEAVPLSSPNKLMNAYCVLSIGSLNEEQSMHVQMKETKSVLCLPPGEGGSQGKAATFAARWKDSMQFFVERLAPEDCLMITVYDRLKFRPDCEFNRCFS